MMCDVVLARTCPAEVSLSKMQPSERRNFHMEISNTLHFAHYHVGKLMEQLMES